MSELSVTVTKRDGRHVPFDRTRIVDAILKASQDSQPISRDSAIELTDKVCDQLFHKGHDSFAVEEIQDVVVEILQHYYPKIATDYAIYRRQRTNIREMKSVENKIISDIVNVNAKDSDDKRENANINADTTAGAMLKIGAGVSKEYYLRNLIRPEHAQMHTDGKIHIHK